MAFNKTNLFPYIFGEGMDAGQVDPKLSQQPSFIKNGVFRRVGAIDKREGVENLTAVSDAYSKITAYNDKPIVFDPGMVLYNGTTGESALIDATRRSIDISSDILMVKHGETCQAVDINFTDDILAISYTRTSSEYLPSEYCWLKTINRKTGAVIDEQSLYSFTTTVPSRNAKLVKANGLLYACWVELYGAAYTPISATGVIGTATTGIGHWANSSTTWDACAVTDALGVEKLTWAYEYNHTPDTVIVANETTYDITASAYTSLDGIAIHARGVNDAVVAFATHSGGTGTVYAAKWDGSAISDINSICTHGQENHSLVVGEYDSDRVWIWHSGHDATGFPHRRWTAAMWYEDSTSQGTMEVLDRDSFLASKPIWIEELNRSLVYVSHGIYHQSDETQRVNSLVLMDNYGHLYGKAMPYANYTHNGATLTGYMMSLPSFLPDADGYTTAALQIAAADDTVAAASVSLDLSEQDLHTVTYDNHLMISGSYPLEFHGNALVEQGFHSPPILTVSTFGGSAMAAGVQYGFQAVYEWTDESGNKHLSTPSEVVSVTPTVDSDGYVQVTTTRTAREDVKINIYRTYRDTTSYHKCLVLVNDQSSNYVYGNNYDDDADIQSNETIYTTGTLSNISTFPHRVSGFVKNRMWIVPRDEEHTRVEFSKTYVRGEAISFHGLGVDIPAEGGRITAIAEYLDKVVVLKEDKVFVIEGDGPNDRNSEGEFSSPYLVDASTGCINQESVAIVEQGVVFLSRNGFCMLGSGFKVEHIGLPVKWYTDNCTIKAPCVKTNTKEVVFMTDAEALVFNYLYGTWSVFTNYSCDDAVCIDNNIHFLQDGYLVKENPGNYTDNGEWVSLEVVSPWVSKNGLGAYSRTKTVQVIGENVSDHTLHVNFGYDFDAYFGEQHSYDSYNLLNTDYTNQYDGLDLGMTYENQAYTVKEYLSNTRCHAVRAKIYDAPPSVSADGYEGLSLNAMVVELTPVRGANRTNDGRKS